MEIKTISRIYLSILFLICLIFTGCQSTPKSLVIINKDSNELNEKIAATQFYTKDSSSTLNSTAHPAEDTKIYSAPAKINDSFSVANKNINIIVNANVIIPLASQYAVIKVVPYTWSASELQKMTDILFPNTIMLKKLANPPLTKSKISDLILSYKKQIKDPNSDLNQTYTNEQDKSTQIQRLEDMIKDLESIYSSAPTTIDIPETTIQKLLDDDGKDGLSVGLFSEQSLENILGSGIFVSTKKDNGVNNQFIIGISNPPRPLISVYAKASSQEQELTVDEVFAQKQAQDMIKRLNINDFAINTIYKQKNIYIVELTKTYKGIPVTYANYGGKNSNYMSDSYTYIWPQERIEITVDNNGVHLISYIAPSETTQTLNSNIELLSFDEIYKRFKADIAYKGSWIDNSSYISGRTIHIDEIRLGLMRVQIKDKPGEYMILPVFDFFGSTINKYSNVKDGSTPDGVHVDSNNEALEITKERFSILTINAIDGSIIDRSLGY